MGWSLFFYDKAADVRNAFLAALDVADDDE